MVDTRPGRCCIGLSPFGLGRCRAVCSVVWPTAYPSEDWNRSLTLREGRRSRVVRVVQRIPPNAEAKIFIL